jgi:hypothetical protein
MAASSQCAWGGGGVKSLAVSAAGKRQRFSVDATGKTFKNMGWQRKSWEFEAVAKETTLEFYTLETTDPYSSWPTSLSSWCGRFRFRG